jgi:hypothetical protein
MQRVRTLRNRQLQSAGELLVGQVVIDLHADDLVEIRWAGDEVRRVRVLALAEQYVLDVAQGLCVGAVAAGVAIRWGFGSSASRSAATTTSSRSGDLGKTLRVWDRQTFEPLDETR